MGDERVEGIDVARIVEFLDERDHRHLITEALAQL